MSSGVLLDTGGSPPANLHRPLRGRGRLSAAAAVTAVVVGTTVALNSGRSSHHQPGPATAAPRTAGQPADPKVVATLGRGTPTVYGGGSSKVYGCPVGYPRTLAGAVQAAVNYAVLGTSTVSLSRATRPGMAVAVATPAAARRMLATGPQADVQAAAEGIDPATGAHLDPATGQPSPILHAYSDLRPEYGAYRVLGSGGGAVTVELWAPVVLGYGSPDDLTHLHVQWLIAPVRVVWAGGDWRLDVSPPNTERTSPAPADRGQLVVPFTERARLLPGTGWLLTADASEAEDWAPLVARTP